MSYIGNQPAESYASFEKQVFTIVNSQTAYTLNHAVTNENDIRLVVNNVVQEPGSGKAYTASGTTLTLSAALVNGTDEMYCVYLGRALQTVNPPASSVGNSQTAPTIITGQTAETSIATDDTILIHDTSASALKKMTRANFVSGIGGTNTPAFRATMSATQSIANVTMTTINFDTETYDSDSCYNTSTYRFTPNVSGKYLVIASFALNANLSSGTFIIRIAKNGAEVSRANIVLSSSTSNPITTSLIELNGSSDYIEAQGYQATGSGATIYNGAEQSYFSACKLIGV